MTQRNWLIVAIALLLALIAPHAVEAQINVKKVKYLGHKYDGEVNHNQIPKGTGTMDFETFTVKGDFDGSNISNPIFKNSQLHFDYIGNASYNESDNIVLKAGGKMVNYGIRKDVGKEVKLSNFELTKDSVINAESMNITELFVSYEVPLNLPQEIDPPKIVISDVLKLTEYIERDDKNQYYKAKGFLCDEFLEKGRKTKIQGYEDGQGRIWDIDGRSIKVVYPDGSYYHDENDFKIVYPNGDILLKDGNGLRLFFNGGLSLHVKNGNVIRIEDFAKLYNSKTYEFKIEMVYDDKGILEDLSSQEIGKILKEKVFQKFTRIPDEVKISNHRTVVGYYYKEGKYETWKERDAAEKAERDREKAAEENALKADRNKFKAKYGFDPISGSAFKVGRPLATIDAWNKWLKSHGYIGCSFKLSIDQGTSKCFDFYVSGKHKGFFWAKNNVITSITWY